MLQSSAKEQEVTALEVRAFPLQPHAPDTTKFPTKLEHDHVTVLMKLVTIMPVTRIVTTIINVKSLVPALRRKLGTFEIERKQPLTLTLNPKP